MYTIIFCMLIFCAPYAYGADSGVEHKVAAAAAESDGVGSAGPSGGVVDGLLSEQGKSDWCKAASIMHRLPEELQGKICTDVESWRVTKIPGVHPSVCIAPDKSCIVVATDDQICVKRPGVKREVLRVSGHDDRGWFSAALSHNQRVVASYSSFGAGERNIEFRSLAAGGEIVTSSETERGVTAACFSGDDRSFFTMQDTRTRVNHWDVGSGRLCSGFVYARESDVRGGGAMALAPSQSLVISSNGRDFKGLIVYDYTTREIRQRLETRTSISSVAALPDGHHIIASEDWDTPRYSPDAKVGIWDIRNGKRVADFDQGKVLAIKVTPDGKYMVSVHEDIVHEVSKLIVWDVKSRNALHTFSTKGLFASQGLAISADGSMVAAGGINNLSIWEKVSTDRLKKLAIQHGALQDKE